MANTTHSQLFRFALSGMVGFLVDAGIVWTLTHLSLNAVVAQGFAFAMAVTVTWWLNRLYTFAEFTDRRLFREWLRYVSANSIGAIVNNGVYVILVLGISLFHRQPLMAVAVGSLSGLAFNFLASRHFVFQSRKIS